MNEKQDVNTKDALLAAAIEVFADKGFDAATVRDICGKANANVAAVNYHYGGKDALYMAVLEVVFPSDSYEPSGTADMDPEKRLKVYLRNLVSDIYKRGENIITDRWAIFLREMAKPSKNLDFITRRQVQPRANELREIVTAFLGPETPDMKLAFAASSVWILLLDHLLTQPILDRLTPRRPGITEANMELFIDHVLTFSIGGLQAVKVS
jgi:AcrR family transcriptional regulator